MTTIEASRSDSVHPDRSVRRARWIVELQGFEGLSDDDARTIAPWLQLTPAISLLVVLSGLLTGSGAVLFALVPFLLAGISLDNHPFDAIYNLGVRRLTGGPRIPRSGAPRRFAMKVATVWLIATGGAFLFGARYLGLTLGGLMAVAAAVPAMTGICLPALLYRGITCRLRQVPGDTPAVSSSPRARR